MRCRLVIPVLLFANLVHGAPAQPAMRFSLKTDVLALAGCVAQPGNVPVPLAETNLNLEIVNWSSAPSPNPHPAEFLLQFKAPTPVGSVIAYEPGQISFSARGAWTTLPSVDATGRKLQVTPFPPGALVEAIKFTVPASPVPAGAGPAAVYRASLPFATFLPIRVANIAADAVVTASSASPADRAAVLNDGLLGSDRNFATAPRADMVSPEKPEWVQVAWSQPRAFRGVALFHGRMEGGAGHAVFESFRGDGDPGASGGKADWEPMILRSTTPGRFGANQFFVSMQPLQSRALRITSTGAVSQITVGEIVVLNHLDAGKAPEPPTSAEPKAWTLPKFARDRIKIDGNAADWPEGRTNGFALAFDDDRFCLLYEAEGTAAAFDNQGTNVNELFHTGDAIDLQLQTRGTIDGKRPASRAGDLRLIFSVFEGKPVCVLYDYHTDDLLVLPVAFKAGERSVECDKVGVLKDAEIKIVRAGERTVLEASVPLKALRLDPAMTTETAGDIGRIVGRAAASGGARLYWSNPEARFPADLASGAEIRPSTWGRFKFGDN